MNRFMIYLPDDNAWLTAVVELQDFGKPQTDKRHLVTLATEADVSQVQEKLAAIGKDYVLSAVQGDVGYHVGSEAAVAVELIKQPI